MLTAAVPAFATMDSREVDSLPLQVATPPEIAAVRNGATDALPRGAGPLRFATGIAMSVLPEHGVWDQAPDGQSRWRTLVTSPGAQSLSLMLDRFEGAESATLTVRGANSGMTQGPYSLDDRDEQGRLWTALVFDDTLIVDVRVPAAQQPALQLRIAEVQAGTVDLRKNINNGIGQSKSCNIDVACPQGQAWQQQTRSTVALTVRNQVFCSGTLVNNTAQDGTPYVITGHHCGVRQDNADTVIAYWNFQAQQCNQTPDNPSFTQTQNVAAFISTFARSDQTLLRLQDVPPARFNVFYSGWDAREGTSVVSGAGIHHPQGDLKKISLFDTPLQRVDDFPIGNQTVDTWRVVWDQGITEAGSSGSALWNSDGRMVGSLFGGPRHVCGNTDNEDSYGRLDVGWEGGGTPDTQLRVHLDPTGVGTRVMDGFDPDTGSGGGSLGIGWLLPALIGALVARRRSR